MNHHGPDPDAVPEASIEVFESGNSWVPVAVHSSIPEDVDYS